MTRCVHAAGRVRAEGGCVCFAPARHSTGQGHSTPQRGARDRPTEPKMTKSLPSLSISRQRRRGAAADHTPVCGTHFGVCLGQGRRQVCGDAAPPLPLIPCSVWLSNTSCCCCSLLGLQFGLFSASTRGAATRIASTRLRHSCSCGARRRGKGAAQLCFLRPATIPLLPPMAYWPRPHSGGAASHR